MRILILNQTFYPDVVATAQYAADLAQGLVGEGHQVTVVCSQCAYDEPAVRFKCEETWAGVRILRVGRSSFGKSAKWRRAADFASFFVHCGVRLCTLGRFDMLLTLTSPPLIASLGMSWSRLTGARLVMWLMDINPDEAVAAGWLRPSAAVTRFLEGCHKASLRRAWRVVALDRFMHERIAAKGIEPEKIAIIAPWTHDEAVIRDAWGRESFRSQYGLTGKFVIMYSGNHSPCHPLDTILQAAEMLQDRKDITFCFIGGGSEFARVRSFAAARGLTSVLCLPYQPLEQIAASLSAADLHIVAMGNPFVGIVHPSKIYNILRLGSPLLYLGPETSHVTELIPSDAWGRWAWSVRHGDVSSCSRAILEAIERGVGRAVPDAMDAVAEYSQRKLVRRWCDYIRCDYISEPLSPQLDGNSTRPSSIVQSHSCENS